MLPGMGGLEMVVIALIALIVIGPKDLPVFLRKLGRFTGKVRGMAQEFRNSFDELARQSELDDLRKEVEALRSHSMRPLGPELDDHFAEFNQGLTDYSLPTVELTTAPVTSTPDAPLDGPPKVKPRRSRRKPQTASPSPGKAP